MDSTTLPPWRSSSSENFLSPGRWITGAGAARWCDNNGVDFQAKKIFLSLPLEQQDQLRGMGTLTNTDNPSRTLMGRIRKVCGPGWIPITPRAAELSYSGRREPQQEIVVCLRGEACRVGGRGQHDSGLPMEEFEAILDSIAMHLLQPLQRKGYRSLFFLP